jgi:hypothetical protein
MDIIRIRFIGWTYIYSATGCVYSQDNKSMYMIIYISKICIFTFLACKTPWTEYWKTVSSTPQNVSDASERMKKWEWRESDVVEDEDEKNDDIPVHSHNFSQTNSHFKWFPGNYQKINKIQFNIVNINKCISFVVRKKSTKWTRFNKALKLINKQKFERSSILLNDWNTSCANPITKIGKKRFRAD